MSTGMICPRWFSVAALYALQKSMMLMPCGPNAVPTGGAGVAPPAWIWIFTTAASFFFAIVFVAPFTAHRDHRPRRFVDMSCVASCGARVLELGHLAELQLDRGLAAEDVHQHLELRAVDVDLADRAVEVGERSRGDPHLLAHLVLEPRPHLLLLLAALDLLALAQPLLDLAARERRGLGATADEPGDARRVAHHVPGVVVERKADEQVARPHLLLHHELAAVLELDDVFHRDDDLEDALLDVHRADAACEVLLHLVLVAGVGVHHEPATGPVVGARLGLDDLVVVLVQVADLEDLGVAAQLHRADGP